MNLLFLHKKFPLAVSENQGEVLGVWDWLCFGLFWAGCVIFFTPLVLWLSGLRWNLSASLPMGFYWRTRGAVERGSLVHVCLPQHVGIYARERGYLGGGSCPGMVEEILKPVAAVAGDVIEIAEGGVSINGQLIPSSRIYDTDSQGRPHHTWITPGRHVVPEGYVFLLSTYHPRSWDSRYFGVVLAASIRGTAQPVWVWE